MIWRSILHPNPQLQRTVFAVGGLTGLVSLFFLTFGVWGLWAAFMQTDFPEWMFAVLSAFIAMGVGAGSVAYRLISGRRRARDGGLLSPWALRAGGLIFAVGPIVSFFNHPWQVLLVLLHWGAAAACFELARRRETYLHPDRPSGGTA